MPETSARSGFTVVIPARLASSRLPNKPLVDIAGLPITLGGAARHNVQNAAAAALAAALLVFVDVMKELPATLGLRPFGSDTLAVVAYQLARDERLGEAALPSLALVLVGLIPVILLSTTLRQPKS